MGKRTQNTHTTNFNSHWTHNGPRQARYKTVGSCFRCGKRRPPGGAFCCACLKALPQELVLRYVRPGRPLQDIRRARRELEGM